jgi:hypothetical protein
MVLWSARHSSSFPDRLNADQRRRFGIRFQSTKGSDAIAFTRAPTFMTAAQVREEVSPCGPSVGGGCLVLGVGEC